MQTSDKPNTTRKKRWRQHTAYSHCTASTSLTTKYFINYSAYLSIHLLLLSSLTASEKLLALNRHCSHKTNSLNVKECFPGIYFYSINSFILRECVLEGIHSYMTHCLSWDNLKIHMKDCQRGQMRLFISWKTEKTCLYKIMSCNLLKSS